MTGRARMKLPRYVRAKRLASGRTGYFFEVPGWAKEAGCLVKSEALGTDLAEACRRANEVLLPAFDSWRTAGASDLVPDRKAPRTFDWLAAGFLSSRRCTEKDRATQRLYRQGLTLVADHLLKDGRRFGELQLDLITPDVADALYDRIKVAIVTVTGEDGEERTEERPRPAMANAAMRAARRAWNVMRRANPNLIPADNPFAGMGLTTKAAGATPTASYQDLREFIAKADELGRASLGTAALLAWEWVQREEDIFGTLDVAHYRPKDRANAVRIVHGKTGEEAWVPLLDEDGTSLYPELTARLDRLARDRIHGLMIMRDWNDRKAGVPLPWITGRDDLSYMRHEVKRIVKAAGLDPKLSFTSFRHGGMTEGGEADITDRELQALSRHKSAAVLPRYAKRTMKQVATVAKKRRISRHTPEGDIS